ncbi:glycosyltransferase family 2 protein [Thermophagus sp. OGC60D27]|uniref:glycosyltransferase family 2 protein n=1 Tax=Thermophagus sp. OGC60D27 TaxID=3458415 RepID=UPI0040383102
MPEPIVAVVILNWNTRTMLERFLPEVIKYTSHPRASIVVADNGSDDGSATLVKDKFPEVEIIQLDNNYGFAGGYNRILKQLNTPYTVLLNSDVIPGEKWLEPLIQCMEQHPDTAACVPKIKALNQPDHFEYAGAAGGFIDKWGYPFCRGRIFDVLEEDKGQYDQPDEIFWGSGAALMVRTEWYNHSGGLDEAFFAHMEEIDWCWRMKNQGLKIRYCPQSEIFHLGGGTLNVMSPRKTYLNFRNNLFMLYRNLPEKGFKKTMLIRLILDGVAALKFLLSGEFGNFAAVGKAHRHYFKSIHRLKKERIELRKNTTCKLHPEIYQGSIVFDFFFRKKHHFTDLNMSAFQKKEVNHQRNSTIRSS